MPLLAGMYKCCGKDLEDERDGEDEERAVDKGKEAVADAGIDAHEELFFAVVFFLVLRAVEAGPELDVGLRVSPSFPFPLIEVAAVPPLDGAVMGVGRRCCCITAEETAVGMEEVSTAGLTGVGAESVFGDKDAGTKACANVIRLDEPPCLLLLALFAISIIARTEAEAEEKFERRDGGGEIMLFVDVTESGKVVSFKAGG